MVDGQARKELKGGIGEVKILTDPADTRIGMEPGQDGVLEGFRLCLGVRCFRHSCGTQQDDGDEDQMIQTHRAAFSTG